MVPLTSVDPPGGFGDPFLGEFVLDEFLLAGFIL
jgi:hypothetical protein